MIVRRSILLLTRRTFLLYVVLLVTLILSIGGLAYGNYWFALDHPGGAAFLSGWQSSRMLLIEGKSPYASDTVQQLQEDAKLLGLETSILPLEGPLYVLILYLPFVLVKDFTLARALWMTFAEICLLLGLYFSIRMTSWRPKGWPIVLLGFFIFLWYPAVRAVVDGSVSIAVMFFVALCLWAVRTRHDELAGAALGLATLKAPVAVSFILLVLLWAVSNRRWLVLLWFAIILGLLGAVSLLFLPSWPVEFLALLIQGQMPNPGINLSEALRLFFPGVGERLGAALAVLVAFLLLVEWVSNRSKGLRAFLWTAMFALVVGPWVGVRFLPEDMVVFLPAILLVNSIWIERWRRAGLILAILSLLSLVLGSWVLAGTNIWRPLAEVKQAQFLLLLPFFFWVLLYWVRWWAIRPPSVWVDYLLDETIEPLLD
jgi:hypothetical protein